MTEQDKDDNVDVLMPPPISVSPNDEAAAKNDVKKKNDVSDNNSSSSCLLYTSPSPRDKCRSRMPSSA